MRGNEPWLKIPYKVSGETVNHKYRCITEKKFSQDKGGKKVFYNQDVIFDNSLRNEPLVIVEGEFDVWSGFKGGYRRIVSVPDGAPSKTIDDAESSKYGFLEGIVSEIRNRCPFVILAVDNDNPGKNLLHDLSIRIGRDFCKYVDYPKGCKDLGDSLRLYGTKGVDSTLKRQKWLEVDGVFTIDDLPPVPENEVYETGFCGFEENFKLRLGDFSVVTGIPSMGKSTFVNDLMARIADKHKLKVAFASLEQHPSQDHLRNLRKWYLGGTCGHNQDDADSWIKKHFCFIYPSPKQQLEDKLDINWFLEKASVSVIQHDAKVVVIDPWNELEHSLRSRETITEYTGRSIKRLKSFAKSNNVHVMVVAHPVKMLRMKDGKYPVPSLYDISDSAHWYNKSDVGIIVHRDSFDSDRTSIITAKSRYHDVIGKTGVKEFTFDKERNRFNLVWD